MVLGTPLAAKEKSVISVRRCDPPSIEKTCKNIDMHFIGAHFLQIFLHGEHHELLHFLINKFGISVRASQYFLFAFLFAVALGTIIGGPVGDRFGRKYVIWFSILGAAPFTLLLPYFSLFRTVFLAVVIGLILASAFSAILVYATDLMPGKIGTVAGLFFGFMFGMAGIGSAVLGRLADATSIGHVFKLCAFLPLIGIITVFLPNVSHKTAALQE